MEMLTIFVTTLIKEKPAQFFRVSFETVYSLSTWVGCFISTIALIIKEWAMVDANQDKKYLFIYTINVKKFCMALVRDL